VPSWPALSTARRRIAATALAAWALEAVVAAAGGHFAALSGAVLVVAPGMAWIPLLPSRVRTAWVPCLAAVPALGFALSTVTLITVASLGIGLDGVSVRAAVALLVVGGLAAFREGEPSGAVSEADRWSAAGLALAVVAGIVLQARVIGGTFPPGIDWAHYVLYADEIRRHGSLLIDNPFWMLGVPFREDPGVPALYGSYLALTGQQAGVLVHGIWVFAVMGILSTFAFVRAVFGALAGALAAAFMAVLPASQDILAWHGLANVAALALLPLVLLCAVELGAGRIGMREGAGFAVLLLALAAVHRLSLLVGGAALLVVLAIALAGERRRAALRGVGLIAGWCVVLGGGVAYDLVTRTRTFGGTQSYTAYLSSKLHAGDLPRALSWTFAVVAVGALGLAIARVRRERSLIPLLACLGVCGALTYAWVVHFPLVYFRMIYFLPLVLAPLVGWALARALPVRPAAAAGVALAVVAGISAWDQAHRVRDFYALTDRASLRGLDAVSAELRPGEVVVTDHCWSFLATWLLHTRTLPALEPADIQPKAEVARARTAREVLAGTPRGRAAGKRLGVRFLLIDPGCTDSRGQLIKTPREGRPVYLSQRLVVLRLPT
jgi:hypothetical protein